MKISLRTVLLTAGVSLLVSNPAALAHTDVTAEQARELIDSTSDLIVVDVRERYEYCSVGGHIPGALNYPWRSGVLQSRYHELPVDAPVLVVCGSGARSNSSAGFLDENGFLTVYDMLGGMSAWQWKTAPCTYSGGSGTAKDPYQIATADDLMLLAASPDDYDKHFILIADIDLDPNLPGQSVFDEAVVAPDTDTLEPGYQGTPFTGAFDGNGHTISRLTITGTSYLGLVGQLDSEARISNLALEAVDVNGTGDYVGGLVGQSISGIITACRSSGTVAGSGKYVGGLVGSTKIGIITDCRSTGTVTGDARFVGGLVGSSGGSIAASCSVGLVSGADPVGGLVGTNLGDVVHCYSSAEVRGNDTIGGLVGFSVGPALSNCYSTGAVTGGDTVGGLVGSNYFTDVARCYSTGAVTGSSQVGGLVGMNISLPGGPAASSFWDIETSAQAGSAGAAVGKTTAEMQTAATFLEAGWDFDGEAENGKEDIWKISEGLDYPRLWWEQYGGGSGTADDPYRIATAEDLIALGETPEDYDKHPPTST
ncbi:MAG: rhodanese-like domain-containing protein [Planctomycetota bacterium]|jgi:rhodanese-related sulfurtransferase